MISEVREFDPMKTDEEIWIPIRNTHHFECQCNSDEHTMKFWIDEDEGTIYTSVFLNDYYPWYKRVWIAIKYVFGYKCKYGHWNCFEMKPEDNFRFLNLVAQAEVIRRNRQTQRTWTI